MFLANRDVPSYQFIPNLSFTYTIQECHQYLDVFENPSLIETMEPQEFIFGARFPNLKEDAQRVQDGLLAADVILVEISTLRSCYRDGKYLNQAALHALSRESDWSSIGHHIITIDECCEQMIRLYQRLGKRPIIYMCPSVNTNRLSKEAAVLETAMKLKVQNEEFYFYDINEVIGESEDFIKLPDDTVLYPGDVEYFGGAARIDYNHYSDIGRDKVTAGIMGAIQKFLAPTL